MRNGFGSTDKAEEYFKEILSVYKFGAHHHPGQIDASLERNI